MTALTSNRLPTIETGVSTYWPSNWAETPDGKLIRVNGLARGTIWNGLDVIWPLGIQYPADDEAPTITTPVSGNASAGAYTCAYRYIDAEGIPSSLSPTTTVTAEAGDKFSWADLIESTEDRVVSIELYRSIADDSTVLYLIGTEDNGTTTHDTDTASDATILADADTYVPLPIHNSDGTVHARRFDPPPDHKAVVVQFQDRFWYMVEQPYDEGSVTITGSPSTVTGTAGTTNFTEDMVGRDFWADDATEPTEIDEVDVDNQTLLLVEDCGATTSVPVRYAVTKGTKERNRIYFSEISPIDGRPEPESVPYRGVQPDGSEPGNALDVQDNVDDHDIVTGGFPGGSVLWLMKERHAYRLRYIVRPTIDGSIKLAARRGMINQRCWACIDENIYVLDDYGPWQITDGGARDMGVAIHDYFRDAQINFGYKKWFFVSANPQERVVRFHVSLAEDTGVRPQAALCYSVDGKQWWVERYPCELAGTCMAHSGVRTHVLVGGPDGKALVLGDGSSDLCVQTGNCVLDSGLASFYDPNANFQPALVGSTVVMAAPLRAVAATITAIKYLGLIVDTPFSPSPSANDTFTVGGAGPYILSDIDSSDTRLVASLDDDQNEFASSVVGQELEFTSGAAIGVSETITVRFAPVIIFDPPLIEADLAGGSSAYYYVWQSYVGTVTSATDNTLSDSTAFFPNQLTGCPVAIIDGTGKGQLRYVASGDSSTQLTMTEDWTTNPDTDSRYMLGAIDCTYRSGRMDLAVSRDDGGRQPPTRRQLAVDYEPTVGDLMLNAELYYDHGTTPETFRERFREGNIYIKAGADEIEIDLRADRSDLGSAPGLAQIPFRGRAHERLIASRYLAIGLQTFQGPEEIVVGSLEIEGA